MATVFWDSEIIIPIDYLEKEKTIPGQYYDDLLNRFNGKLKEKPPHLSKRNVIFHHDNSPAHSSAIAASKLVEFQYELFPQPPYSPDLAPSDFLFFQILKNGLIERDFFSNSEIISQMLFWRNLTNFILSKD